MRLVVLTLALAAVFLTQRYWPWRAVRYGPGIVAPGEPLQEPTVEPELEPVGQYQITSLAEYTITARVLSTRRYRHERAHELVPIDLALGWGRMSDEAVLDGLEISQGFRFFFYSWRGEPPIPLAEIRTHAANVHVIPSSAKIESAVFHLRTGAVIKMTGDLVAARDPAGHVWTSSLTRDDTGPGACELMYVRTLEQITPAGASR